eukprot:3815087-Lingulodinium_polyedra.AAC.1
MRKRPAGSSEGVLWSCVHPESQHKLDIKQKVDRCLLMVIQEQSRQILQVRVDTFGEVQDQSQQLPLEHPAVGACLQFMKELLVKFKDGGIARCDLAALRDKMLKEKKIEKGKKVIRRRPAACEEHQKTSGKKQKTEEPEEDFDVKPAEQETENI